MTLHVLHVLPTLSGGGAELLVHELNERLPAHGVASEAVGFSGPPVSSSATLGLSSPGSPRAVGRLRGYLAQLKTRHDDLIVHAHLIWPLFYVPLAVRGLPIPLVFTEHSTLNSLRRLPWTRSIERLAYREYRHVICISHGVRNVLESRLHGLEPTIFSVVHNGARQFGLVERHHHEGGLRLVSVGSLVPRKGFEIAIDACARCRDIVGEYRIVGEGPLRGGLQKQIEDGGMADKVRLIGWSDEVERHYAWADVMLIPSRWEGFGLSAAEAMSTGLPVIASDVPGLREVIGVRNSGARLLAPGDVAAWAEALRQCANNRRQLLSIASLCHERAKRFSLDRMASSYADVYRQVMEQ